MRILIALILLASPAFAEEIIKFGSTQVEVNLTIVDATTKAPKSDVTNISAGLEISWRCDKGAITTYAGANIQDITNLATYAAPSAASIRFKALGTKFPGTYALWPLDSVFSTANCKNIVFSVIGTGIESKPLKVTLLDATPEVDLIAGAVDSISLDTSAANEIRDSVLQGTISEVTAAPTTGAISLQNLIRYLYQFFHYRNVCSGASCTIYRGDDTTPIGSYSTTKSGSNVIVGRVQ